MLWDLQELGVELCPLRDGLGLDNDLGILGDGVLLQEAPEESE